MRTRSPSAGAPCDGARLATVALRARPAIGNVVRCVLGANDPEHDDVLQSVLERLLSVVRVTPRRGGSVIQLAAIIARNVAVDVRRARARRRRVFSHEGAPLASRGSPADPERVASARERLRRFAAALGALRVENARVVYAHDVLGHELAEIAVMLGISVAAAQSRLVRGRSRIAALLRLDEAASPPPRARPKLCSASRSATRRSDEPREGRTGPSPAESSR
jgi:RNA polymerase sigma factor (sigma-70 family)